jgi:hypothetical protein
VANADWYSRDVVALYGHNPKVGQAGEIFGQCLDAVDLDVDVDERWEVQDLESEG